MTKTKKKILGLALSASMIASCFTGMSIPASADGESTYSITIPSALTVTDKGWNSIGNISASGTLADGKKLTVSAASANSWALTSTSDSVSYTLKNASTDNAATTSWEFTKEQLSTGATQAIGIDVSDYSTKPAGTYKDTVTFTAKVEDAAKAYALGGQPINNGTVIKVNFKWRGGNSGDYVQGTYNADSGKFTPSIGGNNWGRETRRSVYKFEKNENLITVGAGLYDYDMEGMQWTFNTETDTYTYTPGHMVNDMPTEFGLISVTVDGVDVTNELTKQ